MKNPREPKRTQAEKAAPRLAVCAGLGLLVILLGATGGNVGQRIAAEVHGSRTSRNVYLRCRAEVKFVISVVNYLLTPAAEPAAADGTAQPDAPRLHKPASAGNLSMGKGGPCGGPEIC